MQIVIDIPEDMYYAIEHRYWSVVNEAVLLSCVANGIPLPKGHGRLIDELDLDLFAPSLGTDEHVNDLMAKHNIDYGNGDDEDKVRDFALDLIHSCMNVIETSPTIIEAERSE